jgi:DNA-3-methyladenine glycosylase II
VQERHAAEEFLISADPKLGHLIKKWGPCPIYHPANTGTIFESLLSAILSQQLSTKAAATIKGRLYNLFPESCSPPAAGLAAMSVEEFRAVGVSRQKAGYISDLAAKSHLLPSPNELSTLEDEQIIERLTGVKGVGKWTVEMLLMFQFARLDVLPVDDLGIQEGFKRLFQLESRPKKAEMIELAKRWRPYRSVACWYLWEELDNK